MFTPKERQYVLFVGVVERHDQRTRRFSFQAPAQNAVRGHKAFDPEEVEEMMFVGDEQADSHHPLRDLHLSWERSCQQEQRQRHDDVGLVFFLSCARVCCACLQRMCMVHMFCLVCIQTSRQACRPQRVNTSANGAKRSHYPEQSLMAFAKQTAEFRTSAGSARNVENCAEHFQLSFLARDATDTKNHVASELPSLQLETFEPSVLSGSLSSPFCEHS